MNENYYSQQRRIQLILVRHGIALHNIVPQQQQQQQQPQPQQEQSQQQYVLQQHNLARDGMVDTHNNNNNHHHNDDDYLFDPPLTIEGKIQALMIGETIRHFVQQQQPQPQQKKSIVVQYQILTSPLTRCLQTSMYAFGIPNADQYSTTTTTTIHCHDALREAYGIYHCDRRRTKTQLQHYWNQIYFIEDNMSDHDTVWSYTHRETIYELQCRITQFMKWLLVSINDATKSHDHHEQQQQQQQQHEPEATTYYILITHGVWIETMLQMYDPTTWSTTGSLEHTRRIQNADMIHCDCIFVTTGTGGTHHPTTTTTTTTTAGSTTTSNIDNINYYNSGDSSTTDPNNNEYMIRLQNVQHIHHPIRR